MKKLIAILLLGMITGLSYGQTFLRADYIQIGRKQSSGIQWNETEAVDILIKVDQNKAEIYSKTKQVYRKISQITQTPTSSKWLCADGDGTQCHLYVFYLKEKPGVVFIGVEYSDLTWYYTTHFE